MLRRHAPGYPANEGPGYQIERKKDGHAARVEVEGAVAVWPEQPVEYGTSYVYVQHHPHPDGAQPGEYTRRSESTL